VETGTLIAQVIQVTIVTVTTMVPVRTLLREEQTKQTNLVMIVTIKAILPRL